MGGALLAILAAAAAVSGVVQPSSRASTGPVRFVVERGVGAESCPGEPELKAAVAQRLGFNPFGEGGAREIRCTVRRADGAFRAHIDVTDGSGSARAGRDLISRRGDCAALAQAIELAVGIAITPLASSPVEEATAGAAPAASAAPVAPTVPVADVEPPPVSTPPPETTTPKPTAAVALPTAAVTHASEKPARSELGVRADLAATFGLGPGAAGGVGIGASLRRRALSLDLEGRVIGESSTTAASGSATAGLWTVSLGPCVHSGWLAGCAVATAGVLRAHGNGLAVVTDANAPYLALAGRAVLEVPIGARLRLRWTGELAAPLVAVHLTVDGRDAWTAPRVSALTSLGLGLIFD